MRDKNRASAALILSFFNFIVSLIIGLPYFSFVKTGYLFSVLAYISNFLFFHLFFFLLFLLVAQILRQRVILKVFVSLVYTVFHTTIFLDIFNYRFFRFHLNSLALNILTTRGGLATLDLSGGFLFLNILFIVTVLAAEYFVFSFLLKKTERLAVRKILIAVLCSFAVVFTDKMVFVYADITDNTDIMSTFSVLPFYKPVTMKKFLGKFGIESENRAPVRAGVGRKTQLHYPGKELVFEKGKSKPNIVFILIDSFRYDMFSPEISPEVYRFSKKCSVFQNHYSRGNSSRFGVFSLFYGLHGAYWFRFLSERRAPVFMDSLKKLGYDFKILASAKLTSPELKQTCFADVEDKDITDEFGTHDKIARDTALADGLVKWLDERKSANPFFAFVFFDSAHGSYSYTKEFEKFKPVTGSVNYMKLNPENIRPVFNRYKNSIGFNDHLTGRIISGIEKNGLLSNTIVLISGDHGEEFFEHGFYGHNGAFTDEQVKVPLIFYVPGRGSGEFKKLSSHSDVVPTILKMLGCRNESSDYCLGFDFFGGFTRDDVVCATWDKLAVIGEDVTVIPVMSRFQRVRKFDRNYREIDRKMDSEMFLRLSRELRLFVK